MLLRLERIFVSLSAVDDVSGTKSSDTGQRVSAGPRSGSTPAIQARFLFNVPRPASVVPHREGMPGLKLAD